MNIINVNTTQRHRAHAARAVRSALTVVAVAFIAVAALVQAAAPRVNPTVLPINSAPYGKTYGQWSAEHWKWTFSLPVDHHPLTDTADCSAGQSGPVWFLGGTFVSTTEGGVTIGRATRDCSVPAGKALFFPIIDSECSTLEGNGTTDAELRSCAQFFQDHAHDMTCTIDGMAVQNVASYRAQSPLFTYGPLPDNNILGAPAGSTSPSVSDGVFVMLAPPSAGKHTIHFTGALSLSTAAGDPFDLEFRLDITYHLTVQ